MKRPICLLIAGLLMAGWLNACQPETGTPLRIAISKASPNYINWLKRADSAVVIVNLYPMPVDSAMEILRSCSGLLLSGGEDVYPGIYGMEGDTGRCTEIDRHRDSLEIAVIARAFDLGLPVMGICRGSQILNVYLGGTLYIDVPQDHGTGVTHQCADYLNCFHAVHTADSSLLKGISGADSATVTTNHHQAVRVLARGLRANAYSADTLTEGIEWAEPENRPFLLGVQWHPERMDVTNPLSGPLAKAFIKACKSINRNK
jgi:putative glutamine amidotransferase